MSTRALLLAPILLGVMSQTAEAADRTPGYEDLVNAGQAALKDETGWSILEGITTEIGPRLAGTQAEARARGWAVERLKALGFKNVHAEPFPINVWVPGDEQAEIVLPFPQRLVLTALGNSAATPAGGITAGVVGYPSLAAFKAASPDAVRGKIVFVNHAMQPTQDTSSYSTFGALRRMGPELAAARGAAAILIRSIGTDHHRNPHTGWAGDAAAKLPSAALAAPDAEQLARILQRGRPVVVKLLLTPRDLGAGTSGNVIAEVPGTDPAAGIVTIGGHIDSWGMGTGAVDDAAGLAITTAAAKRILDGPRPRRTIRVVWFGAEEKGLLGGTVYTAAHRADNQVLVAESDLGSGRVYRMETKVSDAALQTLEPLSDALESLGIARSKTNGDASGSDIIPMIRVGIPAIELSQDLTDYMNLHHSPDDTLDKVDRSDLQQNIAAWTIMLDFVANSATDLGPVAAETH